jgi:hypothetical protein
MLKKLRIGLLKNLSIKLMPFNENLNFALFTPLMKRLIFLNCILPKL